MARVARAAEDGQGIEHVLSTRERTAFALPGRGATTTGVTDGTQEGGENIE